MYVALWSLSLASVCRVPVSAIVRSCDVRIGSMRVCVECVILVDSCIVFVKLLCWSTCISGIICDGGMFKKSTFRSPRIMILSECSLLFSKDQEKFFQKVVSVVGGRYTQHKKKIEVWFSISIQIHSTLTGSKSTRRRAWVELDK